MKRSFMIIISILLFIPFLNVNAISCYSEEIDVKEITNFSCSGIEGDSLTYEYNGVDYSKYFKIREDKSSIDIIDSNITFDSSVPVGVVKISDGVGSTYIKIKNSLYTTTTSTTTTTTTNPNEKELVVTLDPNDGTEKKTKTCAITEEGGTCYVTLPKLESDNFSGWGTAKTCKEGNSGSIKVDKDITYYACYTDNSNEDIDIDTEEENNTNENLLLKTLKIFNKETEEEIKIGTFSIKKLEYDVKVVNEVENINVEATADDNIDIEISGNEDLVVGNNKIVIKLTDSNNKTNEYIINVERLDVGEVISSVHYLKSLVVGGYDIGFSKDKLNYSLTIPSDIDKLEIDPEAENKDDSVEVLNNENLVDGSVIKIIVMGDDETNTIYNINIVKEKFNILLLVAIGVIILLIIILIVLIIIKSKNKKNDNKTKKNKVEKKQETDNNIEVLKL